MRVIALLALVAGAVSCSLMADLDVFADEHDAGPADGSDANASTDAGGDVSVDRGMDASALDGEAGSLGDASAYCSSLQPAPAFCEDFDTLPLSAAWRPRVDDGGTLETDEAVASSAPRSLRVTMAPPDAGACRYVYHERALKLSFASRARVELDVHLGGEAGGGYPYEHVAMDRAVIGAADGTGACNYFFLFRPGDAKLVIQPLELGSTAETIELSEDIKAATWTRVALEVERPADGGAAATVSVWMNGVRALEPVAIPEGCLAGRVMSVTPGLFCIPSSISEPVDMRVDNIVVGTDL